MFFAWLVALLFFPMTSTRAPALGWAARYLTRHCDGFAGVCFAALRNDGKPAKAEAIC